MSDAINPNISHSAPAFTAQPVPESSPATASGAAVANIRSEPHDSINLSRQNQTFAATYSSSQSILMMNQSTNSSFAMSGSGQTGDAGSTVLDQQTMEFMLAMLILAYLVGGPKMMQQMLDAMGTDSKSSGSSDQSLAASSSSSASTLYMQSSTQSLSLQTGSSSTMDIMA